MKAEVKILVEYNPADDTVFLSSRGVEGDGLPLNVYIGMLQALCRMQKQYNDRQLEITLTPPSEISIASEIPDPQPRIEVPAVPKDDTSTPPTPKTVVSNKPKRFTVEEKTEIAMMYADGQNIKSIAEKFGRTDTSIRLLVSKMGVKRGDDVLNPESPAAESEQPKEKKESVLKKPWYLQSQRTIPSKKE